MKYFLYAIVLFGYFVLPVLVSFWGSDVEYDVEASDPKVVIYRLSSFMIVVFYYLRGTYFNPYRYYFNGFFVSVLFVLFFVFEYVFLSGDFHRLALYAFEVFFVFSIPGLLMAIDMAYDKGSLLRVFKNIHLLMYVVSFGSIMAIPKSLAAGMFVLGDANYQQFSYSCALCFSINFFGVFFKQDAIYDFFKTKTARRISIMLLPVQAVCVLFGAGRGGAVLLIVSMLVMIALNNIVKGKNIMRLFLKYTIYLVLIVAVFAILIQHYPDLNEQVFHFERVFEYISESGEIDMDASSGRDRLYKYAWEQIQLSPLFGYGVFRAYGLHGKCHNMILDLILSGGIVLISLLLLLFAKFFIKLYKMCMYDNNNICLVPLTLYPLVMLQFSGSYLFESWLWFVLSYVLSHRYKRECSPKLYKYELS